MNTLNYLEFFDPLVDFSKMINDETYVTFLSLRLDLQKLRQQQSMGSVSL